jgi:hypothetical protein
LCPYLGSSIRHQWFGSEVCIAYVVLHSRVASAPLASTLGEPLTDGLNDGLGDSATRETMGSMWFVRQHLLMIAHCVQRIWNNHCSARYIYIGHKIPSKCDGQTSNVSIISHLALFTIKSDHCIGNNMHVVIFCD